MNEEVYFFGYPGIEDEYEDYVSDDVYFWK